MLIWIWTRNDETGVLDDEFRDGDVFKTKPDTFEASIGGIEKKSWLIVKTPDPPNYAKVESDLERPEYAQGPSPEQSVIRRKRIYRCDWRSKFTADEIAIIEDATATLPDGDTANGGTVTAGVVAGLFNVGDLVRK